MACGSGGKTATNSTASSSASASSSSAAVGTDPFTQPLPLGDGKVTSTGAAKGEVFSCSANFTGGGASVDGDWIQGSQWDPTKKLHVEGEVAWPNASVSIATSGDTRVITSNDLPDHTTGVFPIQTTDPAYAIDHNPNSIKTQAESFTIPLAPAIASSPSCTSLGPVGIMTNGVLLFNALDAGGRDAVAHEVQDKCDGHPQIQGAYHYHGYSPCSKSASAETVIGYAIDGFGITGPKRTDGSFFSTNDLDECHGATSQITWDGAVVSMYHYVMTADYPYSIGCFKGTPTQSGPGSQPN
jgi:hypothetical protein